MNFTFCGNNVKLFLFDNELHLETCEVIVLKLLVLIGIDVNQKRHLCLTKCSESKSVNITCFGSNIKLFSLR